MPKAAHKVVVIGHRNPDTDSICSAIAYAELKNKTSDLVCEPRRAGKMNQETEFVLKKFGVKPPRMCTDVNPKIRDVDYREMPGIPGSTSLRKAWEIMRDQQIDTLPVTSADNELEGVITVKDIATANMDVFDTGILAKSRTSFRNILETLDGTMAVGSADDICTTGHIRIGTATPEMLENTVEKGDIVILTNRYESQLCAIEKEASLLIICNGSKVGRTIQRIAEEMGVAIMSAPVDTYAAGKLISQCAPISYYMTRSDIMKFTLVTPVADVTRVMAKVRHRYFPILDEDGKYCGMVSRRNIINLRKRRIMLGTFVLSSGFYDAYYKKAKLVQRRIGQEFAAAFQDCDVILTPTAPSAAFKIGENIGDPLKMYYSDVCTVTVNIAGLPAVSVPCGKSASGLPLGMQLIGNKFAEQTILNAAYGYEQLVGGFHAIAETL